jgi:predicted  nucleic acid-binding Zn-ribbon protein
MTKSKLSTKQMLKLLLLVQEHDSQLLELEMRKDFFPGLLMKLKTQIENVKSEYIEKRERFMEVKKEIQQLEIDVDKHKDGLEKSHEKLRKVSTNREYDAVQSEIITHNEMILEIEDNSLTLMDEADKLESDVSGLKKTSAGIKVENSKRIEEITKSAGEIDSIIEKIYMERNKIADRILKRMVRRYEQIREGRQGVAIVGIVDRACGGCMQALPPQKIQDIRAGQLVVCENCGRVLVDLEELNRMSIENF